MWPAKGSSIGTDFDDPEDPEQLATRARTWAIKVES